MPEREVPLPALLPRTGQVIDRCFRRAVAGHGLTPTSIGVLGALAEGGPVSHRELAARLGVVPATLTPVVDALARAGSVRRERADTDRRVVRVAITAAGRGRLADATAQVERLFGERVPAPPAEHEPIVREYLIALVGALGGPAPAGGGH
ncbi:MarR family transcriptional regulator [Pseudonocardia sp.]|uniref:MarR family winged helix-turn-helix transcriptional regulator n=1 Tax=Pseudonocardia sp. TaxID=60912 RepID=UPI00262425E8|nr:MarR family transcriptional regulator [Pseudonocardia sp.]